MTSVLEKIIEKLAPHYCISCGIEDNILCPACLESDLPPLEPVCCLCGNPSKDWSLCVGCARSSGLDYIWAGGLYEGLLKNIMHKYKFERARAANGPLASLMLRVLPFNDWLVVPVSTAPVRVRRRGYDQAVLLARIIAADRRLPYAPALGRLRSDRQVGANRVQRQTQSAHLFFINKPKLVRGAKILLVDDVCTTGATLTAAAQLLKVQGAAAVSAIVAARRT